MGSANTVWHWFDLPSHSSLCLNAASFNSFSRLFYSCSIVVLKGLVVQGKGWWTTGIVRRTACLVQTVRDDRGLSNDMAATVPVK